MKQFAMETGLTIVAVLMLTTTPVAAAKPSLFDFSLKGIVIEKSLASSQAHLSELSLQGIDAGQLADRKNVQRPLAPRALPTAPLTKQPSAIGVGLGLRGAI